jgi:hypothetical protein
VTTSDTYWTMQAALTYGGTFMRHLAQAAICADPANRETLFAAFPQLERDYGPQTTLHQTLRAATL